MENPEFLKKKYWEKGEFREAVEKSAKKKEHLEEGEFKASQRPEEQISAYIERIKNIAEKKGEFFRETSLYTKFIIKPENISDDYAKNILLGNFAEMKGYDREKLKMPQIKENIIGMFKKETGNDFESYQVPKEQKEQITEQTIKDQKSSLDRWFEYLTGPESQNYPDEFKYWSFAEMLKLGAQDRERKDFNKRTKETAAPFPPLNQQALARVLDEMLRKQTGKASAIKLSEEQKKDFQKRLKSENFGKLYAWALDYINSLKLPTERLPIIEGQWRKFPKGSNAKELVDSILEFNTGWCIDGEGTAQSYLTHSDVHIYFSQDQENKNIIPRAAIISQESRITEVRGIIQTKEVKQHLDDYITPVVDEKIKTLPGGETWQTRMEDMKKLAEIHFKHIQKEKLNKEDLNFLYELESPIQSTGYGKDPRIEEIRNQRNPEEDMLVIFECTPEQIAHNTNEINENTRAFVGKLKPGIFNLIQEHNIEHIYTEFPEGKILKFDAEIGGKTEEEIINELEERKNLKEDDPNKIYISDYTRDMLKNKEFFTLENKEDINLVKLSVKDLGFPEGATTDQIYQKAQELGLELCPPETGPQIRLHYEEIFKRQQPRGEHFWIAMKQIAGRGGLPGVFEVDRDEDGRPWLDHDWADPEWGWFPVGRFVFSFRKLES